MPDFTSALYLGMRHPAEALVTWSSLTTGMPAAMAESPAAPMVAQAIARLVGCEQAVLGPSTLHLFWDICGMLAEQGYAFYLEQGSYPIARWGVERAAGRGAAVTSFRHQDAGALEQLLGRNRSSRPVIVADGLCSACGCRAPLADYQMLARRHGGLLLVDDTQALGILGARPTGKRPYGQGGGGSLRHLTLTGPDVLVISSLAKGFGAPLAVLAGSEEAVRHFAHHSETRVHCSPPSLVAVYAAARALQLNRAHGDALRGRLASRVRHFRSLLNEANLTAHGGLFPVQTVNLRRNQDARQVHNHLHTRGVRTVLRRGCRTRRPAVTFVITARHRPGEIVRAVQTLQTATGRQRSLQPGAETSAAGSTAAIQGRKL
ncbi:MAG: aminotransferase class I/II-fold pyridoxal phosphate-dependent enzyme [Anaerolineae bacterium]|nr:aminotransferase class I/II-fold pyridoxal phosphate-dependent enzyme [Anaerolineae bacterium]